MIFSVLGQVEVVHNGRSVPLGAPKQRCVLAALLLEPHRVVPLERLYEAVWGPYPPAAARKAVQVYVSNLRRVLEPLAATIDNHGDGYRMDVALEDVDLHRFRQLAARAAGADVAAARELLHEATRLWRGPVLAGLGDCELRDLYAPALHEECLGTYERRVVLDMEAGQSGELVPELLARSGENPLREPLHALLMKALHTSGRLGDALAVFRDLRRRTVDELGSEPGPEVFAVHQELLETENADDVSEAPEPSAPVIPAQLPPVVSGFTGRDEISAHLASVLTEWADGLPVVGVTGQGGVGKSALALRVAHQVRGHFVDGQLFANLRGSSDAPAEPTDVLATFLRALGVDADRLPASVDDRASMYRTILAGRRVIVVLDDAAGATQVAPLLPGEAQCAVLVTARARLLVLEGAHLVDLEELTSDEAQLVLASAAGPTRVAAEPEAARAIADACGRLPLALRIAASRLARRPDEELAEFADRLSSAAVLDELSVGDVGVRNSLALSYQQLDAEVARAFRLLAVPEVSSLSLAAVASALDLPQEDARRITDVLVDLHLLAEPAARRFRYHDLLRAYARERSAHADVSGERERACRRVFLHLAVSAASALRAMMPSLGFADLELETVDAGVDFTDSATAAGWLADEHVNLTTVTSQVLDLPEPPLLAMAQVTGYVGNYAEATAYWTEWEVLSTKLLARAQAAEDKRAEMLSRMCLGGWAFRQGDPATAVEQLTRFVEYHDAVGEHTKLGRGLTMLALAYETRGEEDEARRCLADALNAHEAGGNRRSYGMTASTFSELLVKSGADARAETLARLAVRIWRELGGTDPYLGADAHKNLGFACAALGRQKEAIEHFETSRQISDAAGYTHGRRPLLSALARAHRDAGNVESATSCFEHALGTPHDPREGPTAATASYRLRHELDEVWRRIATSTDRRRT